MANGVVADWLDAKSMLANKAALRLILEEQDRQTKFVPDPSATPQKARELMIAQGIRAEDNEVSCEILRTRQGG
jgi:hypothetical protein